MVFKAFQQPVAVKIAKTGVLTVLGAYGASSFVTRDAWSGEFSPQNDSLFITKLYKRTNPNNNPTLHDICVRRVKIERVRSELIEDANNGGTELVAEFCRGMWSGKIFAPQRLLMNLFAEHGRLERELWSKEEIRGSDMAPGTRIGGEFEIITITPSAIILRGGQSLPKQYNETTDLRDVDVLAELGVTLDAENKTVEFHFKGIFWCGTGVDSRPPLPAALNPLHKLYAAALLREGSEWCLR